MIDLSPAEFRRLGYRAIDLLADHLAALPAGKCRTPVPADVQRTLLEQPLPQRGTDPDTLLDLVESRVFRYPMGNGSPRFFAWANSPPAPLGVLGDLLAAGLNPSVAGGDHAATYVEHAVLAWMRTIVGVPSWTGGILTSGGSVANLTGLTVMRHVKTGGAVRGEGLPCDAPRLVVYASIEAHSCIQKAIELLGIGQTNLRRLPVSADWRMDVRALTRQIAQDRAAGLTPACVVATAGTVNTGSIDPLAEIADVCRSEQLWFHVDAAIGGPAAMLPDVAPLFRGIEQADSLAVDPHKWMYVPVECGCALVRDGAAMRDAFSLVPAYLRDDTALPWFAEFGIQQSRGFRALKLWLVLQQIGVEGYRECLTRDIRLAGALRRRIADAPDFELVAGGPLSITCFRYRPARLGDDAGRLDELNRLALTAVQDAGDVFLTGTELAGRFALRACVLNFRTEEPDLDALLSAIRAAGERLVSA
jgi:glutamate/tyrosine decarboxylase-like PLP-dependent enzyme